MVTVGLLENGYTLNTHFEYSIDLDRFGGALFSGKANSMCGLEPNCAQV